MSCRLRADRCALLTGGFGIVTRGAVRDVMLSRLHIHDVGAGGVSVEKPADYEDGSAVHNLSLVDSRIHVSEDPSRLKRFAKPLTPSATQSLR